MAWTCHRGGLGVTGRGWGRVRLRLRVGSEGVLAAGQPARMYDDGVGLDESAITTADALDTLRSASASSSASTAPQTPDARRPSATRLSREGFGRSEVRMRMWMGGGRGGARSRQSGRAYSIIRGTRVRE